MELLKCFASKCLPFRSHGPHNNETVSLRCWS